MGERRIAQLRGVGETFIAESVQFFGSEKLLLQDEAHHGAAAGLGPNGLHLEAPIGPTDIEEGMDHTHLLTDPLPVEEMFILFGGQMYQDAIVCLPNRVVVEIISSGKGKGGGADVISG